MGVQVAVDNVGEGQQPPLTAVHRVDVLDLFGQVALVGRRHRIAARLDEHAAEQDQELPVVGRRRQREWVDRELTVFRSDGDVGALEEPRQVPVAAAQIEDKRQRVVFLDAADKEVGKKALAAAGRAEDERVRRVLVMKIEIERRSRVAFKERQVLGLEM